MTSPVFEGSETPQTPTVPLRVVVDANITLAMFLVRRDQPTAISSKRLLLDLLPSPDFRWLWSPDVIADYRRGALAVESDARIQRRAIFDRAGFELLLAALQLSPPVEVSATTLRAARRRMNQAARQRDRDLDDAIYLACAVDGAARLLTSEDSDLLNLGEQYEDVRLLNWRGFAAELRSRGLIK
ncbi:MAG: PIN domain-containing protein [Acidobacteriota bacterium]